MNELINKLDGLVNEKDKEAFEKAAANIIHAFDLEEEEFEKREIAYYLNSLLLKIANQ